MRQPSAEAAAAAEAGSAAMQTLMIKTCTSACTFTR
jgi:hypothetical protein